MAEAELAHVVMVPVQFDRTPLGKTVEEKLGQSAMLALPIASFCGSDRGALYFLEKLTHIDFERCVNGVIGWLDHLSTVPSVRMLGHGTDITVTLDDEVYLMSPKASMVIRPAEWVSIAQYLEVGLVSYQATDQPRHQIEGTLTAEGFVVAHHRYAAPHVRQLSDDAWDSLQYARARNGGAPFVLKIRDSRAVSVTCGDEDMYAAVMQFTNRPKHEFVGEFAFASDDQWDLSTVDWAVNSQLNEAIGGLHIGLGNGVNGAHIDFVAPRAAVQ